jgi:antitoxin FitA
MAARLEIDRPKRQYRRKKTRLVYAMPVNLCVRDLDDELAARLARRAARHGRSAEAEVCEILRETLGELPGDSDGRGFDERAAELRARTAGRLHTPSEILIRESRDER